MLVSILTVSIFWAVPNESYAAPAEPAAFETTEAADCAAAYAETLKYMDAATRVPVAVHRRTRDGLAVWEYELAASAPEEPGENLHGHVEAAFARLREAMPDGSSGEAARARGRFLTETTSACAEKIKTAYGEEPHPVIPFLRASELSVTDQ